jgi:hypothetical protein
LILGLICNIRGRNADRLFDILLCLITKLVFLLSGPFQIFFLFFVLCSLICLKGCIFFSILQCMGLLIKGQSIGCAGVLTVSLVGSHSIATSKL